MTELRITYVANHSTFLLVESEQVSASLSIKDSSKDSQLKG